MGAGDEVAAGEGDGGEPAGTRTHTAVHAPELGRADRVIASLQEAARVIPLEATCE